MSRKHAAWCGVGLSLTLLFGFPAIADDTELLVSAPNSGGANKPNILFILDSSGSMTSIESTQEPYNSTVVYSGDCQSDKYYWTTSSSAPSCRSNSGRRGQSNNQIIDKASFLCAQGIAQMATAGSYTDTMAQHRRSRRSTRWQTLRGDSNNPVECKADSGQHGAGIAGQVYARIGSNVAQFTSDPDREVDWSSSPTNSMVTMYDPNYLNWYHNSPVTEMSRNQIVKTVTKNVLGSIGNVNVGFMEFHDSQGGPVTRAVKDLDSSRSAAIATVDRLPASGWTPLSETMYEAALYWRGMRAQYGRYEDTDRDALSRSSPMTYQNPANYACAKNYTILLTDGEPTQDRDAYSRVPTLPNFTSAMGRSNCTGGNVDGACLDDIAEYLSKEDINRNVPGDQTVATYTIGFKVDLPILKETAEKSGGQYYLAADVKSLTDVLTDIVTNIFDRDISFTAPAVAVNAFNRTRHLNDLYISTFRATGNVHWPGNLKKYTLDANVIEDANGNPAIDSSTGFFSERALSFWTPGSTPDGSSVNAGGALSRLPDPAVRNVYTNIAGPDLSSTGNHVSLSNSGAFDLDDFGILGVAGEPTIAQLIEWIRGVDVNDIDNDPSTLTRRQMGDTLHSQAATIVYGGDQMATSTDDMDIAVYSATNNGQIHAIDAKSGQELWTFVPEEMLPNMVELFHDEAVSYKQYGIDGDIVPIVMDRNDDGNIEIGEDFAYLVFGMRRGGKNYYLLDVTNKNAPVLKWVKNYAEFGQTWSSPVATRVNVSGAGNRENAVLIMGAGYDTTHDAAAHPTSPDAEGAGIFMLDLETGAELWRAGADNDADLTLSRMTRAIPSRIRVMDMSGDGTADRMYAADLGGQIWRFDISNGKIPSQLVAGGVIAQLGAEGLDDPGPAETRRFFVSPDLSMFQDNAHGRRYLAISVGSGYRAHPLDSSAVDRFYSIRDEHVFDRLTQSQYDSYSITRDGDLKEVSGIFDVTLPPGSRGWKFTLPPGEKILAESATFDDSVFFVSFEPQVADADPCQAGLSVNRLYRVSVTNGDPVVDLSTLDPNDPEGVDDARHVELHQGGVAVRPIFLFPDMLGAGGSSCTGEDCTPPKPIGCVGVECFDPGFENVPVRTLWTQDGVD